MVARTAQPTAELSLPRHHGAAAGAGQRVFLNLGPLRFAQFAVEVELEVFCEGLAVHDPLLTVRSPPGGEVDGVVGIALDL